MKSRNVFGIWPELLPPEGVEVATEQDLVDALKSGEIGRIQLRTRIVEREINQPIR